MTDWYAIINPVAGSGKTFSLWEKADKILTDLNVTLISTVTGHKYHAVELSEQAARQGYRKFLAVGGDGTVHEVLTGIMKYCDATETDPMEFYVGIIPIGSGNDFIKSLNIPSDTLKAAEIVVKERFCPMDLIKVSDSADYVSYMANIGGIGFDSSVCMKVNTQKERGKRSRWIYIQATLSTILHMESFNAEVIADGETLFEGPCFSIAFGNGKYSGGGMIQTSLASNDDGLLDVMIIPRIPLTKIAKEIHRLFDGTVHETDCLIYKQCRSVEVSADPVLTYEVDGEVEGVSSVKLEVTGKKINVLSMA